MYYKKRKNRGGIVFVVCILLLLAGFTYGYISSNKTLNKPQDISKIEDNTKTEKDNPTTNNKVNEKIQNEDTSEVVKNDDDANPDSIGEVNEDSEIVFNTYYVKTGDVDTKKAKIPVKVIGANLKEFKEYIEKNYEGWKLRSISTESASLFRQVDGYNPNYYFIQNKDGYIAVYKINESGEKVLYEETDISISTLSETDKKKLNEGILAKSKEELFRIIEDYSS